jgi:hypothetical protein
MSLVFFLEMSKIITIYRTQHGSLVKLTFLDFTTGTPHPRSSKPIVGLPSNLDLDAAYTWGNSWRSCAEDSDVWAGCLLLLRRFVEIGHGESVTCES